MGVFRLGSNLVIQQISTGFIPILDSKICKCISNLNSGTAACVLNLVPGTLYYILYSWEIENSVYCDLFPQPDHRKSKFGHRHAIKLNELYCMTKSEF